MTTTRHTCETCISSALADQLYSLYFFLLIALSPLFRIIHKAPYHTCFISGLGRKWWSHHPKLTLSVISKVLPIIYIFTWRLKVSLLVVVSRSTLFWDTGLHTWEGRISVSVVLSAGFSVETSACLVSFTKCRSARMRSTRSISRIQIPGTTEQRKRKKLGQNLQWHKRYLSV